MWLASSGTVVQSPWWPKEGALEMSIVWVMWPSCFSWVLIAVGLSMHGVESSWVTMTLKPDHSVWATMFVYMEWVWPHEVEFPPTSSGICWDFSLGMQLVELIGLFFYAVWIPPPGVLALVPQAGKYSVMRDSGAGQCQVIPYMGSGIPVLSCNVIHNLWQPLLGLGVHWKDQAVRQGCLPPAVKQ